MNTLPKPEKNRNTHTGLLRPDTCPACRRAVLWVRRDFGSGGPIALDTCAPGAGDMGIQIGLLGVEPTAVRVTGGAAYREHRCPKASSKTSLSFTAGAPSGKRRP